MPKTRALDEWFEKIDRDIGFLIECFAEVLEELGEGEIVKDLPWRNGDGADPESLSGVQGRLDQELQMLSIAYHLLNLVEENAAAEARRSRESEFGIIQEPGLWGHGLKQLVDRGYSADTIADALCDMNVEVVLTAHPTEAKRPAVLRQHRSLFDEFTKLQTQEWTKVERKALRREIVVILERLWRTGEMYLKKPDVLSELDHVLDYFRMVFPSAVATMHQRMVEAWEEAGLPPETLAQRGCGPQLTFGNWVGGDRDGHPLVTAEITAEALRKLRMCALDLLVARLEDLSESLTLSDLFQKPPASLLEGLKKGEALLAEHGLTSRNHLNEPWRQFVAIMQARLDAAHSDADGSYRYPHELADDLNVLRQSLVDVGAGRIAKAEIDPAIRELQTFGFHAAALDIRQNSDFHAKAASQLLKAAGFEDWDYSEWDYAKRLKLLETELRIPRPLAPRYGALGEEACAVLDCFQVVANHVKQYGKQGIGSFIVSMTRDVTDLLVVYIFAREVGLLRNEESGMISDIEIVPLFETLEDLECGADIMKDFLTHPITKSMHVESPRQQVMVGYSDSSKGAGIFASQWALNRAQRALAEVGRDANVEVMFFHGRGGTFSRGAGPTHRFLESLPPRSLTGSIRLTEQGEVIAQKFGNPPTAVFNLELLMAGMSVTALNNREAEDEDPEYAVICDALSKYSRQAYQELISGEGFLQFWANATPIDALERSFIGSRPSRRTGRRTLEDLRAIPWVFSWTQARYYLPGWYGVGSALERLEKEQPKQFAHLKKNFDSWPLLRYVLFNAETSLASADRDIMWNYAELEKDEAVRDSQFKRISDEYERTERTIDALAGAARAKRRPRLVKTLDMRADGLRRLHAMQIELLKKWRGLQAENNHDEADTLLPSLLLSVNAIAGAERTTG